VREVAADELMLVTLAPLTPVALPADAAGITARTLDIAFLAPFMREARWLAEVQADALHGGWIRPRTGLDRRLARLRWHLLDADDALAHLPGETRLLPEWEFLQRLRDRGRERVDQWWNEHHDRLGRDSTLDALACFGGDAPGPVFRNRRAD
jgi:NTE family protein